MLQNVPGEADHQQPHLAGEPGRAEQEDSRHAAIDDEHDAWREPVMERCRSSQSG
jgi:hypothetical protein